jgi:signal transduction histidine kinase
MPEKFTTFKNIDAYLNHIGLRFHKFGFDIVRIWFRSVDKKALVCRLFLKNGIVQKEIPQKRIKIEKSPYVQKVLKSGVIHKHFYNNNSMINSDDPYREVLGKTNINEWIEAPIYDTHSSEVDGVICLISSKELDSISESLIDDLEEILTEISYHITNIRIRDHYSKIFDLIKQLTDFDNELLLSLNYIEPYDPWNTNIVYNEALEKLRKTTFAEIVQLWEIKKHKLIPRAHSVNTPVISLEIDLNNAKHRSSFIAKTLLDRKAQNYIGKTSPEEFFTLYGSSFISEEGKSLFFKIRSWTTRPVRLKKRIKFILLLGSTDFDFLNYKNKLAIDIYVTKISLIATTEERILALRDEIEEHDKLTTQARDLVERRMRSNIRAEMARQILHDFSNNVDELSMAFGIIKSQIENLQKINKKRLVADSIDTVETAISTMSNLLRKYAESKYSSTKNEPTNVSDLIQEATKICQARAKRHNITIYIRLKDKKTNIKGSRIDLIIVFFNLIHNAIDSMIEIRDRSKQIGVRGQLSDKYYVVLVSDNGTGIKNEIKNEIFNSDFSTRWDKGGTGIGLFSSKRIIDSIRGHIRLKSTSVGKGSTFEVKMPVYREGRL